MRFTIPRFKNEPDTPDYGINRQTVVLLEQEIINVLTQIFGPNALATPIKFEDTYGTQIPQTLMIDVVAEVMEIIRVLLEGIEENNIYPDIPNYVGPHYNQHDIKSEEYVTAVAEYSIMQLRWVLYRHLVRNQKGTVYNFREQYTCLLGILDKYAGYMNLSSDWEQMTIEA